MRDRCRILCAALLAAFSAAPTYAADRQYRGEFDPFPHDMSTRDNVVGIGRVSADLAGYELTIHGDFSGLSSPATGAQLRMGLAMGVPGESVGTLTVTKAENGQLSGTVRLTAAGLKALDRNALYIELDSANAPNGNSWAWLETQAGMS